MEIVLVYVDDMLIASNNVQMLNTIKESLSKAFEMKDLGEPRHFIGLRINRDRDNRIITVDQVE